MEKRSRPLHCAFCGERPKISQIFNDRWYVHCPSTLGSGIFEGWCWMGPSCDSRAEAIKAWNAVMRGARAREEKP